MEIHGSNTTFNLENVLRQNILSSDYYKGTCSELSNCSDIVDEIYESVDHVEPWMSGNARGPSTAFCLLHRLFTLKLSAKEVKGMLDHKDSPYIRAVSGLDRGGSGQGGVSARRSPTFGHRGLPNGLCSPFVPAVRRWASCTCATWGTRRRCGAGWRRT